MDLPQLHVNSIPIGQLFVSAIAIFIYNLLVPIIFVLYSPIYFRKLSQRGNWKQGFGERFGRFSGEKRSDLARLTKPVWIHAVSVGETVAALSFIYAWKRQDPTQDFVLSTTTATGQQIARDRVPEGCVPIYCPIDWYPLVASSFNAVDPSAFVIFEVEVWPTMITYAHRHQIPLGLVNTRMSDRSFHGYKKWEGLFAPIFQKFNLIATQTEDDADRIRQIVGEDYDKIHICNTMKFDQLPDQKSDDLSPLFDTVFPDSDRLILLAASTHPGEEDMMTRVYRTLLNESPNLRLVLVPRHAERAADVMRILDAADLSYITLTELRERESDEPVDRQILIVNTTGELVHFLACADMVYMGKSLAGQTGGHNIIEPAIFGKPIVWGENMQNFRQVVEIFKANDAGIEVANEGELIEALSKLCTTPEDRERYGKASRKTVEENRGAISRTIDLLKAIMGN